MDQSWETVWFEEEMSSDFQMIAWHKVWRVIVRCKVKLTTDIFPTVYCNQKSYIPKMLHSHNKIVKYL